MRYTVKSNLASAIASEKSSLESHIVLMKAKNDEHADVNASFEDEGKIMEADDDTLPTAKSTNDTVETSKVW